MQAEGYKTKEFGIPTKCYCQIPDSRNNPELIDEYRKRNSEKEVWANC